MKINPGIPPKQFTPITITLETDEELAKLYALFNHTTICDTLELNDYWRMLREVNHAVNGQIPEKYGYHHKLCEIIK